MLFLILTVLCFLFMAYTAPMEKGQFNPDFPEEIPGMFEGDINEPLMLDLKHRNAVRNRGLRWHNGVVPYLIGDEYSTSDRNNIIAALHSLEEKTKVNENTCIHFVPRTHEYDYIDFKRETGCHSKVGRHAGGQVISIGHGCEQHGTIEHEVLHSLGFWHEQSRYDRDTYVIVHWDNIPQERNHDFTKHNSNESDLLGQPYDYGSLMHYGAYNFAKDRSKPTLSVIQHGVTIGQRIEMSHEDIKKVQLLYECQTAPEVNTTEPTNSLNVVDCNFEAGICNLIQDTNDGFDWVRMSGETPTSGTGPTADHSSGSGYYMALLAAHHHGKSASFVTPSIPPGEYCVSLYYYLWGADFGRLNIRAIAHPPYIMDHVMWHFLGAQHNFWQQMRLNIVVQAPFYLDFQGIVGNGDEGDMAIDDMVIYPWHCV